MKLLAAAVTALLLVGCASPLQPKLAAEPTVGFDLVDLSRVDVTAYRQDYAQCSVLANQDHVDLQASAGAVLSTAADKVTLGLVGGKPSKNADRVTVLKRCLQGRGYAVLR